jgi:serine/threonine protein kinase
MQFSAASLRAIKMEIKVLSQLSHPNIVAFKGACLAPPHICILEELAEGGSLHGRLYSRSSRRAAQPAGRSSTAAAAAAVDVQVAAAGAAAASRRRGRSGSSGAGGRLQALPLSVAEVLRIAVDVASAMQYLHNMQPQVVHRDLKPQNVLLDLQGRAKVGHSSRSKLALGSIAGC